MICFAVPGVGMAFGNNNNRVEAQICYLDPFCMFNDASPDYNKTGVLPPLYNYLIQSGLETYPMLGWVGCNFSCVAQLQ